MANTSPAWAHWEDGQAAVAAQPGEHDNYTYQLYKSGPDVNPAEVELPYEEAVEVTISWGRNVLCTRHLQGDATFTVGEQGASKSDAIDFFIPSEKIGHHRLPLVRRNGASATVVIPPTASGSVSHDGGAPLALDSARSAAAASSEFPGAVEWTLPARSEIRIELADIGFVVRSVNAAKPVPRALGSNLDWNSAAYFGASFVSMGALLAAAAFFMPPMGLTSGESTLDEQAMSILPYLEALAEKEQEPDPSAADSTDQSEGGTGARATGAEGAMGKTDSTASNHRYAVRGPADNPDPHLARDQALRDAAEFGIIGLLSSGVAGDPDAPTAPWGRADSLGLDDMSAMGNMWGDDIGEAAGTGGLGLAGLGEGGGGIHQGIGLGAVGTLGHGGGLGPGDGFGNGHGRLQGGHQTKSLIMRTGQTQISGRLPPQIIQRIVRQNFGRFRLCYEKGLASNPNLEGRVAIRFVIDRNGAVSTASNGGSSLPSGDVTSCVVSAFYGLSFPKPEGGIVTVSYPITFSPG
jgi:hypothetical protein